MEEYVVDKNKNITVYDDLFSLQYRTYLYKFVNSSLFRIGWEDSSDQDKQSYRNLYSSYSDKDFYDSGFICELEKTDAIKELDGYKISKVIVNLSTPSDVNFIHIHQQSKVLLYYVNLDWKDGWFGETLFYSENQRNVDYCSPYTPGRLIAFDASIPHCIRPQSVLAQLFRFTLSIILTKE